MRKANTTTVRNFWMHGMPASIGTLLFALMVTGCEPAHFVARNACELLNCDTLPFIDEVFPLSAGPAVASDGGGGGGTAEPEEEGGGHMH